jgi:putative Holliday junction resolvase
VGEDSGPRFAAIARIIGEWQPKHLVVGLPLATDGSPHDLTRRARRFAHQLEGRFGLSVTLVDERYSSVEAEARLRASGAHRALRDKKVDSAAAQIILQHYFHDHTA